jgi:hypothetical protein
MFSILKKMFDPTYGAEVILEEMLKSRNMGLISISLMIIDGKKSIVIKFVGSEVERNLIFDIKTAKNLKKFIEKIIEMEESKSINEGIE